MKTGRQSLRGRLRAFPKPLAFYLLFLVGGVVLLRMDPFGLTRLTKIYSSGRRRRSGAYAARRTARAAPAEHGHGA